MLYISYHLKLHRAEYYKHLQNLRETDSWNEWMQFFLNAMKESAKDSYISCCRIHKLLIEDGERIRLLARADNVLRLFEYMKKMPLVHIPSASKVLELSPHTIKRSLEILKDMNIIVEIGAGKRDREYIYKAYYDILND